METLCEPPTTNNVGQCFALPIISDSTVQADQHHVRVNPGLRIQDNVWDNVQGNRQFLGRKTVNIKYNWQSCCVERRWREVFALFLCWQLSVIELCQLCYQVTLDTRHQPGSTRPPPGRKYDIMYNLEISAFSHYCIIIKYFTHSKSFWLLPTEI